VTRVARKSADADLVADLRQPIHGWPAPDAVVHLAGSYAGCDEREFVGSDLLIARNLIEWGLRNHIERWVFASAAEVYGDVRGAATEDYPCNPVIPYGKAKLKIERMFREAGINAIAICRLGEVYGSEGRILAELGGRLRSGFCPWPGNGEVPLSFLHVDDAAEALLLACERTESGVNTYNVGDDEPATWRLFLDELAALLGTRRAYYLPKPLALGYALTNSWTDRLLRRPASVTPNVLRLLTTPKVLSCTPLREKLGFIPQHQTFRTGLKEALREK
jgi:nucleoside-diphosphate-sugar epimerase